MAGKSGTERGLPKQGGGRGAGMEVEVRDFGPIAEGRLDLRPLTVFAGPSNTGKSWMATLIYALGNFLRDLPFCFLYYGIYSTSRLRHVEWAGTHAVRESTPNSAINIPENPQCWLDSLKGERRVILKDAELEQMDAIIRSSDEYGNLAAEFLRCRGLGSNAGMEKIPSNKKMFAHSRIGPMEVRSENSAPSQITLPRQVEFSHEQAIRVAKCVTELSVQPKPAHLHDLMAEMLDNILAAADPRYGKRYFYFPEGRGSLTNTLPPLTAGLIRHASSNGALSDKLPPISGVVGDFLDLLQGTGKRSQTYEVESSLTRGIEDRVMGGAVKVEQPEVGLPVFNFHPTGWKGKHLPLVGASSMVAELAPLALFLRYWIRPGDTLILEEPEAHLHPAAQMRLAEEMAAWVKAGIRVIITTHSEWILEKISNMVFRGEAQGSTNADKPSLKKEDVGVWLFDFVDPKKVEQGTKIREIPWEPDEAGYEVGFYDSAVARVDDWYDIRNRAAEDTSGT